MQDVLRQLIGQTVTITTTADTPVPEGDPLQPPFFLNVNIVNIRDFLVTLSKTIPPNPGMYAVSIFDIVGVTFEAGIPITLPQVLQQPASGICACKEQPLRTLFSSHIGVPVTVRAAPGISTPPNSLVTAVGEGTVLLFLQENPPAFQQSVRSLCKVTYVMPML